MGAPPAPAPETDEGEAAVEGIALGPAAVDTNKLSMHALPVKSGRGGNGQNHFYFLVGGDGETRGERSSAGERILVSELEGVCHWQASFLAAWAFVWEMNKTNEAVKNVQEHTRPPPLPLPPTLKVPVVNDNG